MQHHATAAWLYAARKVCFFFFPRIWVSVCVVKNLPEGDRLIAWQWYWRTNWRPFSHLSLAWLSAILMSLFIAILSTPFTSLPLWRDLQCDCDKHLSFSFSIVPLLMVASAYTRSVSFLFRLPVFLFLSLLIVVSLPFLPLWRLSLSGSLSNYTSMTVTDISKRNPTAHMPFRKLSFFTWKRDTRRSVRRMSLPPWSQWIYRFAHLSVGSQGKV